MAAGFAQVGQCRVPDAGAVQIGHRHRCYTCGVVMSLRRRGTTNEVRLWGSLEDRLAWVRC